MNRPQPLQHIIEADRQAERSTDWFGGVVLCGVLALGACVLAPGHLGFQAFTGVIVLLSVAAAICICKSARAKRESERLYHVAANE